ncbi:MAG TPA: hypothetical protein VL360_00530 [Gammaproteobacteria bacterium]|nr:hypothetical protein [Gammaproteobacteria bacterium]
MMNGPETLFIRFFSYGNAVGDDTLDNAKSALSRLRFLANRIGAML